MSHARLRAEGIEVAYDGDPVLHDLTVDVPDGQVTTIIGPNGCGKSTLLRALARLQPVSKGTVLLDDRPIQAQPSRDVARVLALLPQSPIAPEGLLVRDLVARGRHPHQRWFAQFSPADEEAVRDALRQTSTEELADRPLNALSGGQTQRAWIAMTIAQQTELLLLDEPTTYLDLAHQVEVLNLVCRLNQQHGRTVAMVLHDLNLAARYSDHLVLMAAGRIVARGEPAQILRPELLHEVFGLEAGVVADPDGGAPVIIPRASRATVRAEGGSDTG